MVSRVIISLLLIGFDPINGQQINAEVLWGYSRKLVSVQQEIYKCRVGAPQNSKRCSALP